MPYQILTLTEYNNLTSFDPNIVYLIKNDNNQIIDVKRHNNINYYYVRDSYPTNNIKPVLYKIVTIENLNISDVEVIKDKRNNTNYYYVPFELIEEDNNNYLINRFIIEHPSNVTTNVYSRVNQEMNSSYVLTTDKVITLGTIRNPYTNNFTVELIDERIINNKHKYNILVKVIDLDILDGETNYDIEIEYLYNNQIQGTLDLHLTFNFMEYMGD